MRKIKASNQPFDANLHNAIQEVENTQVPAGPIVQVFQDGYMIHDRLLRPAMVVVSKGGPKRAAGPGHRSPKRRQGHHDLSSCRHHIKIVPGTFI